MAAKPISPDTIERIVADWRTGAYSQNELADKHGVSKGAVNKYTRGVAQDMTDIVTAGVQYKRGLAGHDDRMMTAVNDVIDRRTRHLQFFDDASLTIAKKAVQRVRDDEMTMADMRHASEIVARQREGVLGKSPEVAVQINNNNTNQNVIDNISDDELDDIIS